MAHTYLDRLLITLDVAVEAFAVCEVKKGFRLVNKPANAIEVHYVLAGTMHLLVAGAETVVCPRGTVVVVPPGIGHAMAADDGPATDLASSKHCSMTRGGFLLVDAAEGGAGDLRVACGLIMASTSGSFGMFDELTGVLMVDLSDIELVRHGFHVMLGEVAKPQFGTRALVGSLMKACLVIVLRRLLQSSSSASLSLGHNRDPRLTHAVLAVLEKPGALHTVASLSAVAGMGRSTFAHHFGAAFSMSPMEFVAKTRMHHAAEMLRSTIISVKVIATSVGFSSRSHFSRAFRAVYGTDPRSFRKSPSAPQGGAPNGLQRLPEKAQRDGARRTGLARRPGPPAPAPLSKYRLEAP
jgi:AraC family transcriptional activator of mtrCDE